MVERSAGREDERVLGVGLLDRPLVLDREELPSARRPCRARRVQEWRPRMTHLGSGPLDAVLLEAVVADAVPGWREVRELVPDRLRVRVLGPARTESLGEQEDDLEVGLRVSGQRCGFAHPTDAPLGVRERAVLLGEARCGKHDVRVLARHVVEEDVLRDQEVELSEAFLDVAGVRLGLRGVLADEDERPDAAVVEATHHLVEPVPGRLGYLGAPRFRELPPDLGIVDRLVAGQVHRVRTRVVQPLDVVLPAERVQARRLVAEVSGHQHEVRERPDVVDAARVLGDSERVEDRRVPLGRVLARGGADLLGGDAGDLLRILG